MMRNKHKETNVFESILLTLMINFVVSCFVNETKEIPIKVRPIIVLILTIVCFITWSIETTRSSIHKKNVFVIYIACSFMVPFITYLCNSNLIKYGKRMLVNLNEILQFQFVNPWNLICEYAYLYIGVTRFTTMMFIMIFYILIYVLIVLRKEN